MPIPIIPRNDVSSKISRNVPTKGVRRSHRPAVRHKAPLHRETRILRKFILAIPLRGFLPALLNQSAPFSQPRTGNSLNPRRRPLARADLKQLPQQTSKGVALSPLKSRRTKGTISITFLFRRNPLPIHLRTTFHQTLSPSLPPLRSARKIIRRIL